ncbi:putative uridine kinase [Tanacetum coccineum]
MEISSSSLFTTSTRCYVPSSDMVLLKKVGVSQSYQGSGVSMFVNKSRYQPSLSQSLALKHKKYPFQVLCSQKKEIPIVEARSHSNRCTQILIYIDANVIVWSMDEIYDTLAERIVPTAASGTNTSATHIVGLAGPPGAGKTTIASEIVKRVNKLWPQKSCSLDSQVEPPEIAVVLPMDGFHLYRHQLDTMEVYSEQSKMKSLLLNFLPFCLY